MLIKKSPAKINLYLEIVGRTANGYHLLDSLMVMIDIFDVITLEKNDDLQLEIKGSNTKDLQENWRENIVIKAINLLAEKYHFTPNIKITLEKNIPIAAGLGGGSSNAATVLLMLNEFYNLHLSQAELLALGLQLGADVPFFINGRMAFVSGIGEVLKPAQFDCKKIFLLIVNPQKPLSTKEVFLNSKADFASENQQIHSSEIVATIKNRRNDLQISAIKIMPEIAIILEKISQQKNCLISRMSGSGATCFGIFSNAEDLELARANMQKTFPNFYIKKAQCQN
ncbi:MAG: 4-(cytidine 5'-diphospho)-2-C-methyl-D-erythritol kinase [Pseudomonadota bacterium]